MLRVDKRPIIEGQNPPRLSLHIRVGEADGLVYYGPIKPLFGREMHYGIMQIGWNR